MKALYLLKRLIFRLRTDGLKETVKEMIYVNRVMIAIEKKIAAEPNPTSDDIHFIIVDASNYKAYQEQYDLKNLEYYAKTGAQCIMALEGNTCLGYQWVTRNNTFKDLKKLDLHLEKNAAYLFDLFVFPQYRGTEIPKMITRETFNYLISQGVDKIYGYFFGDNLKALWWHRAILKCREIKRVTNHRLLFFEIFDGKRLMLGI